MSDLSKIPDLSEAEAMQRANELIQELGPSAIELVLLTRIHNLKIEAAQ